MENRESELADRRRAFRLMEARVDRLVDELRLLEGRLTSCTSQAISLGRGFARLLKSDPQLEEVDDSSNSPDPASSPDPWRGRESELVIALVRFSSEPVPWSPVVEVVEVGGWGELSEWAERHSYSDWCLVARWVTPALLPGESKFALDLLSLDRGQLMVPCTPEHQGWFLDLPWDQVLGSSSPEAEEHGRAILGPLVADPEKPAVPAGQEG